MVVVNFQKVPNRWVVIYDAFVDGVGTYSIRMGKTRKAFETFETPAKWFLFFKAIGSPSLKSLDKADVDFEELKKFCEAHALEILES